MLYAALDAKKNTLQKELGDLKAEAFSLSVKEIELDRLNRQKQTKEELYKTLSSKLSEIEIQKSSQMSAYDLKIIDKAFIPEDARPDQPKWILIIVLGFMASFLLAFGAVFFIDYWDESFKAPAEIEDRLELPVLCTVPELK